MAVITFAKKRTGIVRFALPALLILVAPLHVGCFAIAGVGASRSEPAGTVNLTSTSLGNRTLAPTDCASGERQVFLGADFLDPLQGVTTRLIIDPTGTASLRLFDAAHPLDQGLLFRRSDCSSFELSLERTGWRINDIYDFRINLEFDCRASSGDTAQGTLVVDHCH